MKTRSPDQTAICISLSRELLAKIDARATSFNIPRSQYFALLALDDVSKGGSFPLPAASATEAQINLTRETLDFLLFAIPVLDEFARKLDSPAELDEAEPEPPESIDPAFWRFFLKERREILNYKWIQSEQAGQDIGTERATREWLQNHFALWAAAQKSSRQ